MSKGFKSILIIGDTHFPYQHPDCISFLSALAKKYKPDKVVHIGDEIDGHSISMHTHSPELLSPADEYASAIKKLQPLYKLFPKVDLLESNHGSLVYRRAEKFGLPISVLKTYRDMIEAPKSWRWHFELTLPMSDGNKVYFCHGKSAAFGKLSQSMSMSTVQGHYHERMEIFYWANTNGLYFDMRVGCLVNDKSLAMAYNNTNLKRPIMGSGVIVNGQPVLCPMILNKKGRWIGKL